MDSGKRWEAGFTFIEVMIAVTILAVGMIVLLDLFSGALSSTTAVRDYTCGLLLAQSRMVEIQEGMEDRLEGEIPLAGTRYNWKAEITELKDGLEKIKLNMSWGRKTISLVSLKTVGRSQ